jgi:hypothetical protein
MPTLAARPFPFALDLRSAALIVVDMQGDFIEPGGFGEPRQRCFASRRDRAPQRKRLGCT